MTRHSLLVLVLCLCPWCRPALQAEDRFFDSNGVKLRYTVQGEGEPVLLIHGFIVNIEMQWDLPGITQALAKDYRVIALDNRGHGKSDKPHDAKQYGLEMVEDAVRLLDHLKIKKAHVVGYSMGAMITAKLLTTHPDRLLSATLGGAGGLREESDQRFFGTLADSLESGKGLGPLLVALTPEGQPRPTEAQIKAINQLFTATNDSKALAAVVRGWKELAVSDAKLKANRVPTLALIGDKDPLKKGVDEMKERLANLQIVEIKGADHMSAFGRAEFINALKKVLAQHREGAKARPPVKEPPG